MNAQIILMCGGCGLSKHIDLSGTPEEIESKCNEIIADDGWRYVKVWDGYICSNCRKDGDKLYELYCGKPKVSSKTNSYKELILDFARQINLFKQLQ